MKFRKKYRVGHKNASTVLKIHTGKVMLLIRKILNSMILLSR